MAGYVCLHTAFVYVHHTLYDPSGKEEADFQRFAADANVLSNVFGHIAPNIHGHDDIKKAVACLLFGGARKVPMRDHGAHN